MALAHAAACAWVAQHQHCRLQLLLLKLPQPPQLLPLLHLLPAMLLQLPV